MSSQVKELRSELKADIKELKADSDKQFADLNTRVSDLTTKVQQSLNESIEIRSRSDRIEEVDNLESSRR